MIQAAQIPNLGDEEIEPRKTSVSLYVEKYRNGYFLIYILSRELGKNVNLFYLNMNFLKSRTEKVSRFLMSGMWKLSLDVENEPAV